MREPGWWKKAIFYQIYPRSFADSNGDGIGDIGGIIQRLDYLKALGIDAVWLSPHFPSPQVDCGYDIADYTAVEPEYGTLDDFKTLLHGLHERGIALILDLVLNHTSDQHEWFRQSRSSLANPKRDWYIWRSGKNGLPPNNWQSTFGGSAWELDPQTGEYYYHYFFKEQPDLNWRNPEVKQAMLDAVRFWLDLGVDGFRLDAIGTLFEHPAYPDHESNLSQEELYRLSRNIKTVEDEKEFHEQFDRIYHNQYDQPGVHELMKELRKVVDEYDQRILVGETDMVEYYGNGEDELHLVFNFPLMRTAKLTAAWIRANQEERLSLLPGGAWPCNTLGNHDSPRVFSRYGDGKNDLELACLHAALMLTLKGTPFLYNGEEIGMTDYHLSDIRQFRDNLGLWAYRTEISALGSTPEEALAHASHVTRDRCRTPMQWDGTPNAGFSPEGINPWLPVNPNYTLGVNAAAQEKNPASLINFYRKFIELRKDHPALVEGDYTPLLEESLDCLAFMRTDPVSCESCVVVLNLSEVVHPLSIILPEMKGDVVFTTQKRPLEIDLGEFSVGPFEVLIVKLC